MQTAKALQSERVTYLTSAAQKAALEAFAKARGESVGNVVREATARYIAQPFDDNEAELIALTRELEAVVPEMQADIEAMIRDVAAARLAVADALRQSSNRR